jgi:hypothetical protein
MPIFLFITLNKLKSKYDEDEIIDSSLSDFADMTDVDAKDIEKDMYFSYYNDDGEE